MEKYNKALSVNQPPVLAVSARPSIDSVPANNVPAWNGVKLPIPSYASYILREQGLFINKQEGKGDNKTSVEKRITLTPVWIDALARNAKGSNYGVQICWIDPDKKVRKLAIPGNKLHDRSLVGELALIGLKTIPGMEQELLRYLGTFEPIRKIQNVDKLGWLDEETNNLVYVMPNIILSKTNDIPIAYQPERYSPSLCSAINSAGTLDEWQIGVAALCTFSDMLIFTISAAFAGPLIKPAGLDGGGFHFYARSSTGKTTGGLQLPVSVWGCGADPSAAPEKSMIHRWNSTANGLEALAAAHNDGILPIDEVGTTDIKAFGASVYNITGGSGKNALNSDRSRKEPRTWLNMIISTGEESVQQRIENQGGKAHAGQLLRIIDIQFPTQLFGKDEINAAKVIDELKQNCGIYYGTAGPKFIEYLINKHAGFQALRENVRNRLEIAIKQLRAANNFLSQEQMRAMKRFALVLVAGKLAQEANILPFDVEAIDKAVITIFSNWQESTPALRDSERGIAAVRDFLQRHHLSRFMKLINLTTIEFDKTRDLAGYKEADVYLFFDTAFKEACGEFNHKDVARALKERGLLKIDRSDHLKCRKMIDGKSIAFYAVKKEIMGHDEEMIQEVDAD